MSFLLFLLLVVGFCVFFMLAFVAVCVNKVLRLFHLDGLFGLRNLFGARRDASGWGGVDGAEGTDTRRKNSDTVVDTRTPDVAKRKIYDASEGEYVDYESVKD